MQRIYFTRDEARQQTDRQVEALLDFPSVPKGSKGIVLKALPHVDDKWVVRVKWHLPRSSSLILAMLGDVSLHFFTKRKAVTDEFCKSEYETLLKLT